MTESELLARLDERQRGMDEKIDAILEQTRKTNGRLLVAEDNIDHLLLWKAEIRGSFKTLIIIFTIVGAVIGWFIATMK